MTDTQEPGLFRLSLDIEGEKRLPGRDVFALLGSIRRHGSIRAAAEEVGVSYRHAWGLLRSAEETLGMQLVQKHAGGSAGGGTDLSPAGSRMLQHYLQLQKEMEKQWQAVLAATETGETGVSSDPGTSSLLLASTMEPVESGLLDLLEQAFYRHSGILVRHLALGSGRALEIARQGRVDLVLTHAPGLEKDFLQEGYARWRMPLLANDLLLVGPASDPAGAAEVSRQEGLSGALTRVARSRLPFVSRQDQSGTHLREQELWEAAGVEPAGDWYRSGGGLMGNLGVLELARQESAYAIVDRATFRLREATDALRVLVARELGNASAEEVENIYSLLAVEPVLVPHAATGSVETFRKWLEKEGRELIRAFGQERFGEPLFSLPPTPSP